jgi:acyl carrier protein
MHPKGNSVNKLQCEVMIREIVVSMIKVPPEACVYSHTDLYSLGLDSNLAIALIVELEERFNIMYEDQELLYENFSTIEKIVRSVVMKKEKDVS